MVLFILANSLVGNRSIIFMEKLDVGHCWELRGEAKPNTLVLF